MKIFENEFLGILKKANDKIIATAGKIREMDLALALKREAIKLLNEAGYSEMVRKFIEEENNIIASEIKKMKSRKIPMKFAKGDVIQIQALQKKEFMDLLNLQENIARKIQEITAQGVMLGMSDIELAEQIGNITDVQSKYITTYLRTSRNQYIQKLHDINANRYEKETGEKLYWKYIGAPPDEKTRPECLKALEKKYFTDEEKEAFETGILFDAGVPRWNCRHSFMEITKEEYDRA